MKKMDVGLMGYGSQGRRIAEALRRQKDLNLIGVGLKEPDLTAKMAQTNEYPIYALKPEDFRKSGIYIRGLVEDLLSKIDVVVDATPAGKANKERWYEKQNVKAIFQSGERFEIARIPVFFTPKNYELAANAKYLRIPFPYTVSTLNVVESINTTFGVKDFSSTYLIAGSEPNRASKGPLDTIIPLKTGKLHLLKEELQKISLNPKLLSAFKIPTLLLSVQTLFIEVERNVSKTDIIALLREQDRILLFSGDFKATDMIFEFLRRIRHTQGDIYEVCVWEEQIECKKHSLQLGLAFDNHCVQTPYIIDAI